MTIPTDAPAVARLKTRASVTTGSAREAMNVSGEIRRKSEATGTATQSRNPPKRSEAPRAAQAVPARLLPSDRIEAVPPEDLPALLREDEGDELVCGVRVCRFSEGSDGVPGDDIVLIRDGNGGQLVGVCRGDDV